jgi:hypothetical protein
MDAPDFIAKYGPLIHILEEGEEDLETIAEEQGYTRAIGREWQDAHCGAVLGYLRAIRTDYEVLWQQTSAKAVADAWLGTWLGAVEKELRHLERRLRFYVFVQRITPPPGHRNRHGRLRRFLLGLSPKVRKSDVEQILCTMRRIHQRGDATVYLP